MTNDSDRCSWIPGDYIYRSSFDFLNKRLNSEPGCNISQIWSNDQSVRCSYSTRQGSDRLTIICPPMLREENKIRCISKYRSFHIVSECKLLFHPLSKLDHPYYMPKRLLKMREFKRSPS